MIKLGITGNIGSGKTTVCALFEALGVPVIYADRVSRQLLEDDPTVMEAVMTLLGKGSYRDGIPDRAFIAAQVFGSKQNCPGSTGLSILEFTDLFNVGLRNYLPIRCMP
ncbi:MAG: dephospho-CoA kinase [Saprospiraceae bacterium]|nr:dephospho-CoA kinase [Saprospiraceae bacterium]